MEVKDLADKIQTAVDKLHQADDERRAEIQKLGEATGEVKAKLEKVNNDITDLQTKLQRKAIITPGEPQPLSEEKAFQKKTFFKWMREGKTGLEPQERKALVSDATGLYLVPEDLESEIIRALPQLNAMRRLCGVRPTTRDKVKIRGLTEVSVGWGKLETGTEITESTPTPSYDTIYVEDLYGLCKLGEDLLQDTDTNLQAIVANSFAIALANAEEAAFAIGTGHTYSQPEGIAVDAVYTADAGNGKGAGYDGTYGSNWTTDDTVIFEDIIQCEYDLATQYLQGASWLMNRKTELAARVLRAGGYTATDGPWLWQPSLQVGQPNLIDGFPVFNNNSLQYPADTLAGVNVIFGNFKNGYMILDRQGMTLQRLDELYAESGLVGFKVHMRVGGGVIRYPAFHLILNDV